MTLSPCLDCGEPTTGPRCPEHTVDPKASATDRGYDGAWTKLSRRARRLQPFCTDCGTRRTQGTFCRNTCLLDHDGECNDGGPGASGFTGDFCDLGTDCADCGPR